MTAIIVTGLGFGDEGKGMVTAWLASNQHVHATSNRRFDDSIVIRYGGGNQIAHTVKFGDNYHVHHHLGSGTLFGVPTYYSEYCVVDPIGTLLEIEDIQSKFRIDPTVYYHPRAMIVTPMDVRAQQQNAININQGTVGVGFGTTVKRNEIGFSLYLVDLKNPFIFKSKLKAIQDYYCDYVDDMDVFMKYCNEFYLSEYINICNRGLIDIMSRNKSIDLIFEGHQGVLLDMEYGTFPHVTRSKTTVKNALSILRDINYTGHILNIMITRSYHTRHGNGPFWDGELQLQNESTEQNGTHIYQGNFRKAPLDIDILSHAIHVNELDYGNVYIEQNLLVTCCDQLDEKNRNEVLVKIAETVKFPIYTSYSPDGTQINFLTY